MAKKTNEQKILITAVLVVTFILGALSTRLLLEYYQAQAFVTPILNNQIIISTPSPINMTEALLENISDIAFANSLNKTYKLHVYDCTDFSRDLVIELNKSGINAYCIFGRIKKDRWHYTLHSWTGVVIEEKEYYFDAIGGFRISPEIWEYWDYRIISRGKCL